MGKRKKEVLRHTNIYPLLIIYSVSSAAVWSILVIVAYFERGNFPIILNWINEIFIFPATFFHIAGQLLELGEVLGKPFIMFLYLFIPYIIFFYAVYKRFWKKKRYS